MSLFGSIFGDSKDTDATGPQRELADVSKALLREAAPLRQGLMQRGQDFMSGNLDLTQTPQYRGLKAATDAQYGTARNNIIASTPTGGPLIDALARMEGERARSMEMGIGDLAEREMARTFALGTGHTPTALGGMSSAAGAGSNIAMAQSQQNASALQGIGVGVGRYLGGSSSGKAGSTASSGKAGSGAADISSGAAML